MKVATEKVWADSKGNLVPDGSEDAAFLVASAGKVVPNAHAEQYKGHAKFFKDLNLDDNGQPAVMPKDKVVAGPGVGVKYNMVGDHGAPDPENREADMPKIAKRAPAAKVVTKPAKKKAKK